MDKDGIFFISILGMALIFFLGMMFLSTKYDKKMAELKHKCNQTGSNYETIF